MNKKLSFLIVVVFASIITSCAGSLMKSESDDKDLVEIFNDSDSEKISKFITSEEPEKKEEVIQKTEVQPEVKAVDNKKAIVEPVKKIDPRTQEDYPKEFIKYDEVSKKYWDSYQPVFNIGEEFRYEISWSIFKAGIATISTKPMATIAGQDVLHINALLESAEYFEGIYKLKDSLDVYIAAEEGKFSSLKYEMKQRESGQIVDDLQLFDHDELKTYFFYNRLKNDKRKKMKKVEFIPRYFTDSFSSLYFLRGLAIEIGAEFNFPIITRGKVWILKASVDNVEEIEVLGKTFQAYKITAQTQFPGVLKKSGDINFWIATDDSRALLKFSAKVKIGTVKGELISIKYAQPSTVN